MLLLAIAGNVSAADTWVKTAASGLQTGDVVVIVDQTSGKAMSNGNGTSSAPTATAVTLDGDKITSTVGENIQWEVIVNSGSYQFNVPGTENYLYCTNTNNGVRVGTNENNAFTIYDNDGVDFLMNTATSRYLGVYNSQDWRCYTSINANINACVTTFYKKVSTSGPVDPTVTISAETVEVGKTITISGPSDLAMQFESDDEGIATVSDEGVVTGVAAGEAIITVSWTATDSYNAGSKDFTVTVIAAIPSTVYEKVTDANQLVAGNKYILVAEENNKAMGVVNGNIRNSVDVKISDNKVSITDEDVTVLTLGGISGAWTFLASDNSEYLAYSGSSNQVHSNADATADASKWKITENFELESAAVSGRVLKYNSGSPRFACYASGQKTAVLFVKEGSTVSTKADPGFSFSASTAEANVGEEFTAPTFSNPNNVAVTFESSNTAVATVDESGNVTIVAAGETTITASSEETDDYLAGTASYTLAVTDPNAPGTENNPYTVAQALEAIDALADNGYSATEVYIKGIVSGIKSIDVTKYERAQYYISDDGTETDQLLVYNGYYLGEGVAFTANDQIQVGDEVVVYGKLQKYVKNGTTTPEVAQNNYLVSLDRPNQPKYYVVGYHNNWDNGAAVTENLELKRASDGTLKVSLELGGEGQNGDFKIIKVENDETTAWYGATADGSYWITADNHDNITLVDGAANLHLNTYGAYDFMLDISGDQPKLSVDGDWPRQKYYLISDPDWDSTDMTEMIYNEETSAYETELTVGETAIYFAIADQQMDASTWNPETDWADFNANHRYAIEESSDAYELTKENSLDVQLQKVLGTMKIATPGTYTITLTEDLKLTVTGWPKELPEGNAFVKVASTDDLTDGYYLIVYEGDDSHASVAFNGGLETLDAVSNTIDVTIGGDKIVATDENKAAMFYIDNNAGTLQSESGFYIGKTANSNGLDSSDETQYTNTFSIDEDGYAVITASGNCTLRYNYASDQNRFRYYRSGQQAIALYKLTTVEPVEVTLNKYGYATLYYGDMSLTVPEGVTATTYDADVKESVTYAAGDVIPAGEAVVLKGEANAKLNFELGEATAEADANNALMGLDEAGETVAPGDGDYKFYMLSAKSGKVGFYYGAADGVAFQTAAHKAYLVVPTSQAKLAYIFDETTGIQSVDNNTLFATGKAYNLNGQRVDKNYKGVVIVDGKKMINK